MAQLLENFRGIKKGWNSLDATRKTIIGIIVIGLITSLIVYYFAFGKENYVPVFSDLDIQDSSKIVSKLEESKITKYKLEDGGSKILVPEGDVDKLRLQLAMEGALPSNGIGFEIFDNAGFAVTNEDRKIMYQRAMEGELQRSIMTLEEVDYARVHISLSEDSIFSKEVKPASASVVLGLNKFEELSPGKIKGIISLVSGAVKDLPEENIRVIDTNANLLSDGIMVKEDVFNSTQSAKNRMEMKNIFEKNLEKDLQSILEKTLGVGNVLVKISANLDFDSKETTTITYDKDGALASEQQRIVRNEIEGEDSSSPIDNNTSNTFDEENVENNKSINSYEAIRNYEIGETTTRTMTSPGEVLNLSTSVIYNGNLSEEMKTSIQNIVTAAIGYKAERGDMISIEGIEFNTDYQDKLKAEMDNYYSEMENVDEGMNKWVIYGMIAGGALILLLLIVLIIKSSSKKSRNLDNNPYDFPVSEGEYRLPNTNQGSDVNYSELAMPNNNEEYTGNNINVNDKPSPNNMEESFKEARNSKKLEVTSTGDENKSTGHFSIVEKADTKRLVSILKDEHPQTIALILCNLDSDKASDILSGLPGEIKAEISERIVNMKPSTPFVIKQVEKILEEKLSTTVSTEIKSVGGVNALIDILKGVDRITEKHVMEEIENTRPQLAQEIRKSMFVFEDIIHLDSTAIQRVIRDMDKADLSLALKAASDNILNHVYKNMSKRASENLKEDIEFIGPVKLSEVEEAQQKLVNVVRKLHKSGEIDIIRGAEDEVVL